MELKQNTTVNDSISNVTLFTDDKIFLIILQSKAFLNNPPKQNVLKHSDN